MGYTQPKAVLPGLDCVMNNIKAPRTWDRHLFIAFNLDKIFFILLFKKRLRLPVKEQKPYHVTPTTNHTHLG